MVVIICGPGWCCAHEEGFGIRQIDLMSEIGARPRLFHGLDSAIRSSTVETAAAFETGVVGSGG